MYGEVYTKWYKSFSQEKKSTWFLPFVPGFENGYFDDQTISLNATVYEPETKKTHQMYDMRNLYGLQAAQATHYAHKRDELLSKQRPFIVSESTFAASSG